MTGFKNPLTRSLTVAASIGLAVSLIPASAHAGDDIYRPGRAAGKVVSVAASDVQSAGVICQDGFQYVLLKDALGGARPKESIAKVTLGGPNKKTSPAAGNGAKDFALEDSDVCDQHGGVAAVSDAIAYDMQCALGARLSIDVADDESLADALEGTDRVCHRRDACVAPPDGCMGPVIGAFPNIPVPTAATGDLGTAHNSFVDLAMGISLAINDGATTLDPARFAELTDSVLAPEADNDVQGLLDDTRPFMSTFEKFGGDNFAAYEALKITCGKGVDPDVECTSDLVDFYGDHFLLRFNDLTGDEVDKSMLAAAKDAKGRLHGVDLRVAETAISVGRGTNRYWRAASASGAYDEVDLDVDLLGDCSYCEADFNGAVGGAIVGSLGGGVGAVPGAVIAGSSSTIARAATDLVGWITGLW